MNYSPTVRIASEPATRLFRNIQFIYELELAHWELVEFATEVCKGLGMTLVREIKKIIFGLYNVMQSEKILVFRKG